MLIKLVLLAQLLQEAVLAGSAFTLSYEQRVYAYKTSNLHAHFLYCILFFLVCYELTLKKLSRIKEKSHCGQLVS